MLSLVPKETIVSTETPCHIWFHKKKKNGFQRKTFHMLSKQDQPPKETHGFQENIMLTMVPKKQFQNKKTCGFLGNTLCYVQFPRKHIVYVNNGFHKSTDCHQWLPKIIAVSQETPFAINSFQEKTVSYKWFQRKHVVSQETLYAINGSKKYYMLATISKETCCFIRNNFMVSLVSKKHCLLYYQWFSKERIWFSMKHYVINGFQINYTYLMLSIVSKEALYANI